MKASRALRWARLTAALSQRALAEKSGIPQSTIGRIETDAVDPRSSTLSRLVRACGYDLEVEPLLGEGIDRTLIREQLALSPDRRLQSVDEGARTLALLRGAKKVRRAS